MFTEAEMIQLARREYRDNFTNWNALDTNWNRLYQTAVTVLREHNLDVIMGIQFSPPMKVALSDLNQAVTDVHAQVHGKRDEQVSR